MIALYAMIAVIASVWFLWIGYVTVMHLQRVRRKWRLTRAQKVMGYPVLAVGYPLDIVLRLTLGSALFVRWPQFETVSDLLEREEQGEGWRATIARWVREDLLADFDPTGDHGDPGRQNVGASETRAR